ncbi:MAG: GNAT family N-acetyltransferase [Pseudomonadota bacterium]
MIRPFRTNTDADLLIAGEVDAFSRSYPGSEVPLDLVTNRVRAIDSGQVICSVLDIDGPQGYVIATKRIGLANAEIYIVSVYVAPTQRGRGHAGKLIESLLETSVSNEVILDVSVGNEAAVSSYQALGFEVTRLRMVRTFP